ncbi:MAG TPA: DUF2442 domain-containing protein [Candidatus Hydrogenedentes bacterium]|jgi:hypothetical protein|nr:DUF2442 domain-containing protein [Candidatus Hydrogenedentota bacterium]
MVEVTAAKYVKNYRIFVVFNTGEEGEVDLEAALWGPVFEPLKNLDVFKRFEVSPLFHTIVWENEADFAPEFLRDKLLEQRKTAKVGSR